MGDVVIEAKDLRKGYGDKLLFDGLSFSIPRAGIVGIVGPNGAGKTTLFRLITGEERPDGGSLRIGETVKLAYVSQSRDSLDPAKAVWEEIGGGEETIELGGRARSVRAYAAAFAFRGSDQQKRVGDLSGGERNRVHLAKVLSSGGNVLLLDEPTNHLDAGSVAWLERTLAEYRGTVVAVTHDRYFLDNVAGWILELDRGYGIPWEGNYSSWLEQKRDRLAKEEKAESARQRTLERELEWVRMSPRARVAKNKARLAAYEQLLAETAEERERELEIWVPPGPRLGDVVIEAKDLRKGYGDKLLFDGLSFSIPRAGIVGIVGPNGAGKTTLFRLITGEERPDGGSLRIGETVKLAYVSQSRDSLDPAKAVWEEIGGGEETIELGGRARSVRAYAAAFAFRGSDQQKRVGDLSGGERNRVHLAKVLSSGGNVLLLDEPTNDLDVDTLRALEDALLDFAGCVLLISHDRWFIDRTATHILAFEGDSVVRWAEGNWSDYEEWRRRELGDEAARPHRIRYRPLTRA
ncbi:MAG: energy-dependent translational throttle protein EttA [Chloroflexi bacterium RIFCSPLOWO2_12_FULL_71_12]|nr:MAG: energy-dependent translational throttle protein EttA [Chloroflexi bacterium RIFCSPLOWO2_12_FULL_71_12]